MDYPERAGETQYTRYDVIGWGSGDVVRQNYAIPDGYWFGSKPRLLVDHRGPEAEAMIPKLKPPLKAIRSRVLIMLIQDRTVIPLWRTLAAWFRSWD